MAEPSQPDAVLLIVGAFSARLDAIGWARENLQNRYGPIVLESPPFDFHETHYYDAEMGTGLKMVFFAFERLIEPTELVDIKLASNELERQIGREQARGEGSGAVARPLNLDPGYLNAGKWVLATTKDQAHRLVLGRGIYAEVTLRFERGEFVAWSWTYPNYRRDDYRAFFKAARAEYLRLLRASPIEKRESTIENPQPPCG